MGEGLSYRKDVAEGIVWICNEMKYKEKAKGMFLCLVHFPKISIHIIGLMNNNLIRYGEKSIYFSKEKCITDW